MRPYLAIIKDSFREAMASKVLWIILVLCILFLAGLVPLSVMDEFPAQCYRSDIKVPALFAERLFNPQKPAEKAVAGMLSDDFKSAFNDEKEVPSEFQVASMLLREINGLLGRRDLYEAESMKSLMSSETSRLLGDGVNSLDDEQLPQFNRRLLADIFPAFLPLPEGNLCRVSYFGGSLPAIPFGKTEVMELVMKGFVGGTLGFFGVFLPLLFTANMIPRTFESGSIDMLLSKPVFRSWVFLAKYAGGCSFVTIIAAFVITGLYLIFGLRLGYWHWRLFLCIPVFIFNFGVYYCVSAITGLIWRNAIVAIIISLIFWFSCTSVGTAKEKMYEFLYMHQLPEKVVLADDVMTVDTSGQVRRWDKVERQWVECFNSRGGLMSMAQGQMGGNRFVGPIYDTENGRLLAFDTTRPLLMAGYSKQNWQSEMSTTMPTASQDMFRHSNGDILAVSGSGVHRLTRRDGKDQFQECSQAYDCGFYIYAAIHPVSGDIAVSGNSKIVWLKRLKNGVYKQVATIDKLEENRLLLCFLGTDLLAADSTGHVIVYDASLKETARLTPQADEAPKMFVASRDGRSAFLLFHNHRLMMIENSKRSFRRAPVHNQGKITGVSMLRDGSLAVSGDINRVYVYDAESLKKKDYYKPQMDKPELVYRYGIVPIYTLFPSPGEISNISSYLITGDKSFQATADLTQFRQRMDLWKPIWSCLLFIAVILAYGCFRVARRDF